MADVQCDAVMAIDTQWFLDRLAERKLSQRGLAKLMGVDPSAISLMFRNKRRMTIEEAAQIAVLLNASTGEVLRAAGVEAPTSASRITVIGYVNSAGVVSLEAEGLHETVDAPPGLPADAVAIQSRTAGATLNDGYLYFMSGDHLPPDSAVGHLAMAAIRDNGLQLTHVRRGYSRGVYNLVDWSGAQRTNVSLAWAVPILWIKTTA